MPHSPCLLPPCVRCGPHVSSWAPPLESPSKKFSTESVSSSSSSFDSRCSFWGSYMILVPYAAGREHLELAASLTRFPRPAESFRPHTNTKSSQTRYVQNKLLVLQTKTSVCTRLWVRVCEPGVTCHSHPDTLKPNGERGCLKQALLPVEALMRSRDVQLNAEAITS